MTAIEIEPTNGNLTDIEKHMDALANSSFQSLHENDNLTSSGAQLSNSINQNQTPSTPPLNTIDDKSFNNIGMTHIPNLDNLDNNIGNGNIKDTTNISVIGLEPIQSPRKSIQRILLQPLDNKPRLVIERLVLTNFKSYAGRQEIGPFHPSFSAVVGPNGSGKSNVIDSMLFVFGFRAAKMRQSKLKELIHNSENFPDLDFCQVDIYFKKIVDNYDSEGNNLNNPTILHDSDLIVSRRANKNNSSTYYINNRVSSYKEVTTMLKDEGIDLDHKRFLILQGEVEMIAQMKPKAEGENDDGLLEYLEDIIGTSAYKEEIENTTNQIEILQEQFNEKERRFEYSKKHFSDIEAQKDAALNFLKLEKKYKDETAKYWYLTSYSKSKALERYNSKFTELNEKIEDDNKLIENFKNSLENLKLRKNELNTDLNDINVKIGKSKNKFKSLEKEQVSSSENLKILQKKSDTLNKTLTSNRKTLGDNKLELNELNQKMSGYEGVINDLNQSLKVENDKLEKIKYELSSETKKYSDQIEELQKGLEPWKHSIDKNQSEFNIKNSEIELLKNQLTSIKEENNTIKSLLDAKNEQIKINTSKVQSLKEQKVKLQSNIDKHESTFQYAGEELKRIESELKEINDKVEFAKNKVSSFESQNKVLAALTRLQETGRISGFYGKLGDLGVIDDRYDVAVSTGGGALSDYVVDTVEDAQNCIQYLRQNNLGFGKFIVLEKLRKFNLNKINTPENVPRLFDLIKPVDPKFSPAFYSSMYDTLVAPNLSVANRVAFGGSKRWRVVTLDGKLVDVSGTMSGGGTRVNRGALKLTSNSSSNGEVVSPQQLQTWKQDLNEKEENYRKAETAYRKMNQLLRNSREEIPKMSSEILRLEMESDTLHEEINDLQKSLQESTLNEQKIDLLKKKVQKYCNELDILKADKAKLDENSSGIQSKIDALHLKILDIGGLKLKTQTAKVQALKDEISLKSEVRGNDELKSAKLQNQNTKLTKLVETSETQLSDLQSNLERLKNDYDGITVKVNKIESELNTLEIEKTELAHQISEVNDKIEEEDAKLREHSELISDTLKQINKIESIIQKIEIEINHSNTSINNIDYRDVAPYIEWMDENDLAREDITQKPLNFENIFTEDELKEFDLKQLGENVDSLKVLLGDTTANIDILLTFGEKEQEFANQKKDFENSIETLKNIKVKSEELNERRHTEFKEGFNEISSTLKVMYYLITAGGMAELEYYDSHDAFSEGIVFSVMPPKKSWRTISNLSGGEKTLASLALVFALHHYKPTPLYVMDEIDAALDFKNVSIVANYIKSRTKNAQFIVISLRNNMFELAESLVGIYKVNNMTRSATLANRDLIK
jgi:structural maintenance of chromosome 4